MMSQIISSIVSVINAVNGWFMAIVDATGAAYIIVGFISIFLSARFILQPIIGGAFFRAASDKVKKSRFFKDGEE